MRRDRPGPRRSWAWLRRVLSETSVRKRDVLVASAASVAFAAITVAVPAMQRTIIDDVYVRRTQPLAPWLWALVGVGAASFAVSRLRRLLAARLALRAQLDLRNLVFDHMQRLGSLGDGSRSAGQVLSRVSADLRFLMRFFTVLPAGLSAVVLTLGAAGVMMYYSPLLALVSLALIPVIAATGYWSRRRVYPMTWDAQQRSAEVYQILVEGLAGVRVIRAFGCEQREIERLVDAATGVYRSNIRSIRFQARYQAVFNAIPSVGQAAILALGGWLALEGHITVGTYLAFATFLVELISPVRFLASLVLMAQQARVGAERIFDLLDSVPEVQDDPDAQVLDDSQGDVCFDGVGFAYSRDGRALDDFTLQLPPGTTTALVGRSGSGKSTVATLLARLADVQAGAIRLDGKDLRDLRLSSVHRHVAVVFEDPFLFSGSVRDNIAFGRPDASDADVERAARAAGAHEFISELPDGYAAQLGEGGFTLSGGQRQRLTIARAILTQPSVLILDDATSAVDADRERQIHGALRELVSSCTTLVIAHRRSTLDHVDRVAVVDAGRIVDVGRHEELLGRCDLYRVLMAGDATRLDEARVAPAPEADDSAPVGFPRTSLPASTSATPKLLARVAALKPEHSDPDIDLDAVCAPEDRFSVARFLRPFAVGIAITFLLVAADTGMTLIGPYIARQGIDNGVLGGSTSELFLAAGILGGVGLVDLVARMLSVRVVGRTGQRMLYALQLKLWTHLQTLSVDFFDRHRSGQLLTRLTSDTWSLYMVLQDGFVGVGLNVVTLVGVAVALFVVDAGLAVVVTPALAAAAVATVVFRARSKGPYREARERLGAVTADLQENLSGLRESVAFGQQARRSAGFRRYSDSYLAARLKAQRLSATYFSFLAFLSDVAAALVLWAGYGLVLHQHAPLGTVIAFLLYVDMLFEPMQQLSSVVDDWQEAAVAKRRIAEVLEERPATPPPLQPLVPPAPSGSVCFNGVQFTYPGRREPAVTGIDLAINPGEIVAIVGPTGAGKSTLVKLLARFYDPECGQVLVDGIDVRELDPSHLRRTLGYIPQEPYLFPGTVAANIGFPVSGATLADVRAAANRVGVDRSLRALPAGYQQLVGAGSSGLSAGQRQLIALARAEMVRPPVYLLDEATSGMDQATESTVCAALRSLSGERTVIVVAHRPQMAAMADRVIEVSDGRLMVAAAQVS